MTTLTVNSLNYHVEIHGDGIPLVLLHGFTGSTANWQRHLAALSQHFMVITVDLLGHGQTVAPLNYERYSMEQAAADLATLFQMLTAAPVHLLGYSMGGRLALYMAVHYPDLIRSLILESASPGLANDADRLARQLRDEDLADRIERDGIETFVNHWEDIPLFASQKRLPEHVRAALRDQRLRNQPHGLANSLRGMGTGVQPPLWDCLPSLKQPILLLAGDQDEKFVGIAEQMQALMPYARTRIIPDAGHTVHLEQPDVFDVLVIMFIHQVAFFNPALDEKRASQKAESCHDDTTPVRLRW